MVESSFTHSSSRRRVTPGTSARGPLLLKRAAPRAAAALTKPSETSRLPTTGMCQDEDRTEMPRAGTAEVSSSAPTRQHRKMAALLLMAAARILGGLRSSSCSWWVEYSQRVGAQLYWNRWAAHGARRAASSPLPLKKKRLKFNGADGPPRAARCLPARDSAD